MATTANTNYACETALQKSKTAAAYIVNNGSDAAPVIPGVVTVTTAALPNTGSLAITALANVSNADIQTVFPATCSGIYSVSFVCTTPGQQWNVSGVGSIVRNAGVTTSISGFSGTAVASALLGTSPTQTVAFCEISANSSGAIGLYNATGVALTGTVTSLKIASSLKLISDVCIYNVGSCHSSYIGARFCC